MDILSNPAEAPRADPHAGCCGGWGLNTPGYPISLGKSSTQPEWDHSITRSARRSTVDGMVMPNAVAALRFSTSS